MCQEGGARLCTAEELQNDEARGAGCNYDGAIVWLMSPAPAALPSLTTPTGGGGKHSHAQARQPAPAPTHDTTRLPSKEPFPAPKNSPGLLPALKPTESDQPTPAPTHGPTRLPTPTHRCAQFRAHAPARSSTAA